MHDIGHWFLAGLSIVGVILNIKRRRECFVIWGVTNLAWAIIDFSHGIPAQGTLQLVYFGLAVWGMIEWRKSHSH